jgi:hypothetical protein
MTVSSSASAKKASAARLQNQPELTQSFEKVFTFGLDLRSVGKLGQNRRRITADAQLKRC